MLQCVVSASNVVVVVLRLHLRPFFRGDVCICVGVLCVCAHGLARALALACLHVCVEIFVTRSKRARRKKAQKKRKQNTNKTQTKHKEIARAGKLSSPAHLHPRPPFDVGAAQARVEKSHARVTRMQ